MRGNSPFTISGGGMGVFEGQGFASAANMGQIASGFMGDFGAAKGRKGRKAGIPVSVQTGTSPGASSYGRKTRKGAGGIPMSVHNPRSTQQGMRSSVVAHDATAPDSSLVLRRTMPATRAQVTNGRVNVDFNKIDLDRSAHKYSMMGLNEMQSMPPGLPGSRGGYGGDDLFGLGQTTGRGFGQQMGARGSGPGLYYGNQDIFGLGQTDPLAMINAPLVELAKRKLAEYRQLRPLVDRLPRSSDRDKAMSIVNTKWVKTGFLGLGSGKGTLPELELDIAKYAALSAQQFVYYTGKGLEVSRTREERLMSFRKGVNELRKFMEPFVIPMGVRIDTVDRTSAGLLSLASDAAGKARASRNANDISVALSLAESARNAADDDGNATIRSQAIALVDEMNALAKASGGAVLTTQTQTEGPQRKTPWAQIAIGGAVIVGIGLFLAFRK